MAEFQRQVTAFETAIEGGAQTPAERYGLFASYDPYPMIPPALLNAGHLASYALAAAMIQPFELDQLAKPATYLVKIEGPCRYVDQKGRTQSFYVSSDPDMRNKELDVRSSVCLAPNSVCYITLAPDFRLPAYICARFNLLIRDIYRGLLVGTGPLVDPGFTGRLSIPVHNFTTREYILHAGEDFVYFEFSKISWTNPPVNPPTPSWLPAPVDDQPPFPASKGRRKTLDDYLTLATGGGPPQNAIGAEILEIRKYAEQAKWLLRAYTIGGIIAVVALAFSAWSIYDSALDLTLEAQKDVHETSDITNKRLDELQLQIQAQQNESKKAAVDVQKPVPIKDK